MRRNVFGVLVLLALCPLPALAQSVAAPVVPEAEVERLESALADDSMQGRLTGSSGGARAARLIANEMKAIGLRPMGDSGFYQRVPVAATDSGVRLRTSFSDGASGKHETAYNVIGLLKG